MARYPTGHKDQTRQHLVDTAREEFRRHGFEAASIDKLMKAAGLTRGGFYAHFASKEALVQEVLGIPSGLHNRLREDTSTGPERRAQTADAFESYLDPNARDERVMCPMVAHPMDAYRGGDSRAELYGEQVTGLIELLEAALEDTPDARREATLLATLAIGAAILGRAVGDDDLASEIENTAASEVRRRLTARDVGPG